MNALLKAQLRSRMKAAKLTQKKLSLLAGLGETAVSDILNDKSQNPTARVLTALAAQLGCKLSDLTEESSWSEGRTAMPPDGHKTQEQSVHHGPSETVARRLCQLVSARVYDAYPSSDIKSAAIEDYSTFLLPDAINLLRQGKSEPEVLHTLIQRSRQKVS